MNWLTDFIRPRIRSIVGEQKDVPDNLWQKCPSCEGMLFHRDLADNLNVCYHCNHHLRIPVKQRFEMLFDNGKYDKLELPNVELDPLKFKDRKKYVDRLKETQHKTGFQEAITLAKGTIGGQKVVIAAFNFAFMGGSMSAGVGEAIVKAAETAVKDKAAFITIPSSGGARMQEGMLSLLQMPRSIIAVEMVKDAGLPYIVILTDPTTGGVSASFAMVGDIHIAEPGSMIGFAGRRVIEETVRETLPDDFQTAEYLKEHGIVDMVVNRKDMAETLGRLLSLLMNKKAAAKAKNGKAA
ncbi:MAG: acetyl-CoA carboxylase carboxyltransferase subunit beta [Alphaproteobacteria bacterium]|nr:acetyl-CoA carboxylase carboxyltransferase subunit beta [Alphaproteobacteria bacterium]